MRLFISWSGGRSQELAKALRDWLPLVLHYVKPWLSEKDIAAGDRWGQAVAKELKASNFGIICITPENVNSPWVLFEAGALSKSMQGAKVIPLLLNLEVSDIIGPLAQFQAKKVERSGLAEVVLAINHSASTGIAEAQAKETFDALWPDLEKRLAAIENSISAEKARHLLENRIHSLLFGGSEIDNVFCVKYGETLLCDSNGSYLEKISAVLAAKKTNRVSVERHNAYTLMHYLFRRVSERKEQYWALATELDLDTPEAYDFLFKAPQAHPLNIVRVYVLRSQKSLEKLIAVGRKDLLAQIGLGAKLKVLIDATITSPNFGIYGTLAVGEFSGNHINTFDFNRNIIENKRGIFGAYRKGAVNLKRYLKA